MLTSHNLVKDVFSHSYESLKCWSMFWCLLLKNESFPVALNKALCFGSFSRFDVFDVLEAFEAFNLFH